MKLFAVLLFFIFQLDDGIAPIVGNFALEIFAGQRFQSDICEAELSPVWSINNKSLIDLDDLQSSWYNASVMRSSAIDGKRQATLVIDPVYAMLNGSVVTCSANFTRILTYTLVVVNTTIVWLPLNETFRPKVCTSPLVDSPAPYWIIDDVALSNTSVNNGYGAKVNRSHDGRGRYQVELIIGSVDASLNGNNISCLVGSELRRVYILYITPPRDENTTTDITLDDDSAIAANNATGTSKETLRNTLIRVLVPVSLAAILCITVVIIICVTRKCHIFGNCKSVDAESQRLNTTEIVNSSPVKSTPTCPSDEQTVKTTPTYPSMRPPPRVYQPTYRAQRGAVGGEDTTAKGQRLDIRFHCENMSTDGSDVPGVVTTDGILEANQGQEHGAARVYGKDTVELQQLPKTPLKNYLTEEELSRD